MDYGIGDMGLWIRRQPRCLAQASGDVTSIRIRRHPLTALHDCRSIQDGTWPASCISARGILGIHVHSVKCR